METRGTYQPERPERTNGPPALNTTGFESHAIPRTKPAPPRRAEAADRDSDRGSDRGGDRGSDRGGDRGSDRGGNQVGSRASSQGSNRGRGPTITLGICLAAGLAAGIGLMRPGTASTPGPVDTAGTPQAVAAAPAQGADGYGVQTPNDPVQPESAAAASIDILDFSFGNPLSAIPGSTITVANRDAVAHTLTSADGAFDTGVLDGNGSVTLTAPQTPGTYSFFCSIHPSMQGSLTVAS